ncbi:MAG TPA: ABC transporter ATP-binding protein [Eubacteriaceae bacterium]|nr:ABC transporter ATP-binding protein [Eubacteriaceae bacterium]
MIEVQNLEKSFGSYQALRGLDLHVKKGEIYGFIGHNGAGKSTAMNILAGLSKNWSGTCVVNGMDVADLDRPGALNLGFLPEDPRFYPWMSAKETLDYLGNHPKAACVEQLLDWAGLKESKNRRVGGFSRGMKQRLGLATALIRDPELVILDEPSSALDPEGRSQVLRMMLEMKEMGKTVLFSSHILSDVERICDTVGMIAEGKMVMEKPLKAWMTDNVSPIYSLVTEIPPSPELIEQLKTVDGVEQVEKEADRLMIRVADSSVAAPKLMAVLAERQVVVESFFLKKNSLEDLFMKEGGKS